MSKLYTTNTAALKAVTIDSNVINTKKLMIYPGGEDKLARKNILELINETADDITELQTRSYAYTDTENTFTAVNNFKDIIHTNNIIVDNGAIEFANDGEITLSNGASGWPYTIFMPDKFENGKIYDLGLLTSDVDLSSVAFDGDDTIIQTAEIWFTLGDTIHNIIWPANVIWIDTIDGTMPPLTANLNYRISIRKEVKYLVASISYTFKTPSL